MTYFESGAWRPYERDELLHLLCEVMPQTPLYCRLSRVIRDIPSTDIHEGNQESNFREVAEKALAERGVKLTDIRAREVKLKTVVEEDVTLRVFEYDTSVSRERFLSFESDDALLGFCRLSLPTTDAITPELEGCAMIREVHVYGQSLTIGEASGGRAQHRGLGSQLVDHAAGLAREAGFERLAVISAIGTRVYYRKLGFEDGELYQHRALPVKAT
jgi:elongator complex protein 3